MVPKKWLRAFWYEAALLWHINCSEWVVLGQNMNYPISYFSHCAKCCPPHFAAQQKWTFKNRIAKGGWWKSRGGYFSDATYLFLLSKREENWEENRYATRFINMQPPFSRDSSGKSERHKCDICSLDYVLCFSKPCLQMISPLDYVLLLFETLISEIRMLLGQISTLICKLFRKIIYFFTKRKSVLWRLQLTSHTGTSNFSFSKVTQIHFWFHKYSQNYFDISSLASFNHYKSFLRTNSLKNNSKILYFKKSINRYLSDVKLKFFTTVISATFIPARGNHQFLIFHFFRFSHFFRFLLHTLQIHII